MKTLRSALLFKLGLITLSGCAAPTYMVYGSSPFDREAAYFDTQTNLLTVSCHYDAYARILPDKNMKGASLYCISGTTMKQLWHVAFANTQTSTFATTRANDAGGSVTQMHIAGGLAAADRSVPSPARAN